MKRQGSKKGPTVSIYKRVCDRVMPAVCFSLTVFLIAACLAEEDIVDNEKALEKVHERDCGDRTCPEGEYCDREVSPYVCRKHSVGEGEPCQIQEDCAGFAAGYCETYVSFTCLVKDCDVEKNNCSTGYICCGFTDPTTFPSDWELPESLCLDKELQGDECVTR